MDFGEASKQPINEADELQNLMMIQQQEEMFGEKEFTYDNFDNAEMMHILAASDMENNQNNNNKIKKKYQRHTAHQIQHLEAVFRQCPHPDERQRFELSRRLGLDLKQIKFWFQNKRTQTKTQTEHNTNILLKEENDKLRRENDALKAALAQALCENCRSPVLPVPFKKNAPVVESTYLKECYSACAPAITGKSNMCQPFSHIGLPSVEKYCPLPGATGESGSNRCMNVDAGGANNNNNNITGFPSVLNIAAGCNGINKMTGAMVQNENLNSLMMELAAKAMEELLRMTEQGNISLWIKLDDGIRETLNFKEYVQTFPPVLSAIASNPAFEASRETGLVRCHSNTLVDTFMDAERWKQMFPSVISAASTIQIITPCIDETKNGIIQLMEAELQVLSPMVPLCRTTFLRYCKQCALGKWAIVDVSADTFSGIHTEPPYLPFRQHPSGCIIEEFPNGCSKVTWVAHYEYDENAVTPLYRSMMNAGFGFGSIMWLARLKRQCQCISFFEQSKYISESAPFDSKRGLLYLAQRISNCFCYGVCSSRYQWDTIQSGSSDNSFVFIKSRMSIDQQGEPSGIVLSATRSFWLPVIRDDLFDYLRNVNRRYQWDTLSQDEECYTILNFNKGGENDDTDVISIFGPSNMTPDTMVILQDSWSDDSASVIAYAPLQMSAIQMAMEGGDSASLAILPSGFAIHSDTQMGQQPSRIMSNHITDQSHVITDNIVETDGSLLTVGFQVLVNSNPLTLINEENIRTLNSLVVQTCNKIRESLGCV